MMGSKLAGVVLIEFSDYQCQHCRRFATQTMKQIETDYIGSGRVGFILRHSPSEDVHEYAFKAAEAVQCAGAQGRFWEMHRRLFEEPMALGEKELLEHAQTLGLDIAAFQQCLSSEETAMALRRQMRETAAIGLKGTPLFLVGVKKPNDNNVRVLRMIPGTYPYDVFKTTLDTVLTMATR
jgi:protein-disulfide isomerase